MKVQFNCEKAFDSSNSKLIELDVLPNIGDQVWFYDPRNVYKVISKSWHFDYPNMGEVWVNVNCEGTYGIIDGKPTNLAVKKVVKYHVVES